MAVYTEVGDDDLQRLIEVYGLGRLLSYKGIAEGVENTNYVVHTTSGTFILTLYERRVDPADLPFFLGFMEHLAARGVRCPVPVRTRQRDLVSEISGRCAALITFLEGVWPRRPSAIHCAGVGRALAEFHAAGAGFAMTRANGLGLSGWTPLFETFSARADEIKPGLSDMISTELAALKAHWPSGLRGGIIHADLFPDNVFFIDEAVSGIIDFYFACNDALAYDIAVCLNAWCFEPDGAFDTVKGRAMLQGYESVRPLDPGERDAMPVLARGAAMRFLLTRSFDWLNTPADALVSRKDPMDYVRRLTFHRDAQSIAAYGLA